MKVDRRAEILSGFSTRCESGWNNRGCRESKVLGAQLRGRRAKFGQLIWVNKRILGQRLAFLFTGFLFLFIVLPLFNRTEYPPIIETDPVVSYCLARL